MDLRTAQALIRFGLGRRGDEPLPSDPTQWLQGQLRQPDPTQLNPRPNTATAIAAFLSDRQNKPKPEDSRVRALFRAEVKAELENALTTPAPYRERLVWFWTNHFTVSIRGGIAARCLRLHRGGDPAVCHRPLRRNAVRGDASPVHAACTSTTLDRLVRIAWLVKTASGA